MMIFITILYLRLVNFLGIKNKTKYNNLVMNCIFANVYFFQIFKTDKK